MEWVFSFDAQGMLVLVKVEGRIQAQKTAEMAIQGISFARERNCHKFIIDYTLAEVGDSTIDTMQFMANLEKLGITHLDNIAIVYSKDQSAHHFAETVAANRGWSNVQYFDEMEKARNWLLGKKTGVS